MPCRILVHSSKVNAKGHGSKAFVFALTPRIFFAAVSPLRTLFPPLWPVSISLTLPSNAINIEKLSRKAKDKLGETKLNELEMKMLMELELMELMKASV